MAESYFELLTEQEGLPTKSFDPVEELKRLRRELTLRSDLYEPPPERVATPPEAEPIALEPARQMTGQKTGQETKHETGQKIGEMKRTMTVFQRSRLRTHPSRKDMFRGSRKPRYQQQAPSVVARYLTTPQEGTLESVNAGLMSLGVIAVIFGFLCLLRGLESDLTIGTLVCATGAAIVAIGIGGRFLASRDSTSKRAG